MKAIVYGCGAVGARVARHLASADSTTEILLVDQDLSISEEVAVSLGSVAKPAMINALRIETRVERFAELCETASLVILATHDDHAELAEAALRAKCHVVSVSDDLETVQELQELNYVANQFNKSLVIGAGFSPGLTCLLAIHAANAMDVVDEIHISKFGTGGPECARQHHKALRSDGLEWRNQQWEKRRGGTGRELCWFPDPVGGMDCFYAALPEPLLIHSAFSSLVRLSSRVAATRRDMSTKWLPMLRRPHPEGIVGTIRVDVRGWKGRSREVVIMGALDRPAVAAGTVAAVAGMWALNDRFTRVGAAGLAELVEDPVPFLQELAELGVKAAIFEGTPSVA